MCAIQFTIDRDHFWLKPEPKTKPLLLNLRRNLLESARQLLAINEPITKRRCVVVPMAKPAIVEDKQLNTQICRRGGDLIQFGSFEIEIGRLPIVDDNWTGFIAPLSAAEVLR